jgi:hypothetical protein
MTVPRLAAFAVLAVIAAAAQAQGVYKTIGPDGKVIYTDTPPGGERAYSNAKAPAPAAKSPSSPAARTGDTGTPERAAYAKKAGRAEPAGAAPAPATAPNAQESKALERAVIGVLGLEDLVVRTEKLCNQTLPTSMGKYSGAVDGWKQRNGGAAAKARTVLADAFTSAERQLIETGLRFRNESTLTQVAQAPAHQRIQWCDQSAGEINAGKLDPKANLTGPIFGYRGRNG